MPYEDGSWGEKGKLRSKRRLEYFKKYSRIYHEKHISKHYPSKYQRHFEGFGSFGEKIALRLLLGSKLLRNPSFDLKWGKKRIEVKIRIRPKKRKKWCFPTGRQKGKTDYFFLICMNRDRKDIAKIYLIPDNFIPNIKNFSISENEIKYERFKIESEVINVNTTCINDGQSRINNSERS